MPENRWREQRGRDEQYGRFTDHPGRSAGREQDEWRGYSPGEFSRGRETMGEPPDDDREFGRRHEDRWGSGHHDERARRAWSGPAGEREWSRGPEGRGMGRWGGGRDPYPDRYGGGHDHDRARGVDWRGDDAGARWAAGEFADDREAAGRAGKFRGGHYGRGPRGYMRSDDRIREDVNDCLTDDWRVDATNVEVAVASCEVTLSGTVNSREEKRRAEDLAEDVSGVKHVQNNLRVQQADTTGMYPGATHSGTTAANTVADAAGKKGRS
ncbi:MAG: BON domain-containing protein [Alphaproteobacteria bacterium]